jgi:hypothetical protein
MPDHIIPDESSRPKPVTLEQALQPLICRGSLTMPPRDRATPLPEMPLTNPVTTNPISDIIIEDRGPL